MREQDFIRCSVTGKRCYSEREANVAISSAKKHFHTGTARKTKNGKIPRRKYFCESCKSWHLTSQVTHSKTTYLHRKKKYIKTFNYQNIDDITIDNYY